MGKILKGTYYLKENLELHQLAQTKSFEQTINFKINEVQFNKFSATVLKGTTQTHYHLIYKNSTSNYDVFAYSKNNSNNSLSEQTWFTYPDIQEPKTITITADTTVSDEFYFWFMQNVMTTIASLEHRIGTIIEKIEGTTNKTYENLTEAVRDLITLYEEKINQP